MSVIRIKKSQNYVSIHKSALEDTRLSFKAKGLWAYCMTRPNDWEFHANHLATVSKDGIDAVYTAINELEQAGYCKKVQRNYRGRFQPVDYEIFEISQIKKILPQPDLPQPEKPDTENPPLLSIDCIPSIDKEVVCPKPPVGASGSPNSIKKIKPDGIAIEMDKSQMFSKAISLKKDWKASEMEEAWEVLAKYEGRIYDIWKFIEGTIKNIRTKSQFKKMEKACHTKETTGKGNTTIQEERIVTPGPPLLILEFLKNRKKS